MALHKDFSQSPHAILDPAIRWFPADEALRETSMEKLMPQKMTRLLQWCEDINRVQSDVKYGFVYVDQESFEKFKPASFRQLVAGFREYKEKI